MMMKSMMTLMLSCTACAVLSARSADVTAQFEPDFIRASMWKVNQYAVDNPWRPYDRPD